MSVRGRLNRLEQRTSDMAESTCPRCAPRQIAWHTCYRLLEGGSVILPPIPPSPPCTCRRPREPEVSSIIVMMPEPVTREEAERHHAEQAAFFKPWQPIRDREKQLALADAQTPHS